MKSTRLLAVATSSAACALALAACSAGSGVPGLPGFGGTASPADANPQTAAAPCADTFRELAPPDQDADQAGCIAASPTVAAPTGTPGPTPAPTPAPGPTAAPSTGPASQTPGGSADPAPTQPAKAYGLLLTTDKNKFVDSKVPFVAGVVDPGTKKTVAAYAFERMDVDFACTGPDAVAPENGHFVRVFYFLGNSKADRATGPTLDVTAHTWTYLNADGSPWLGTVATGAAKKCLEGDDEWGGTAKPGWVAGGELIFDVPSTDGTLQHTYKEGMGGWRFPVENANTSFRSLDERAAERFGK